jgi:RHS repeat-associated protein
MDRPTGLKDQNNNTAVSNVSYNAANQYLNLLYFGVGEGRTYNSMNQMTNLAVGSGLNITYTFPGSTNNGKISSQTDGISGETVTYQYDSLNRLLSATSTQSWSDNYGYDGFGNLLSKTSVGGAPTLSQSVNIATNQIVGQTYDSNGNQLSSSGGTLTYDAENRVLTAPGLEYGYDSTNKRVWRGTLSGGVLTQTVYAYGTVGQLLGTYSFVQNVYQYADNNPTLSVYFAGKRVGISAPGQGTAGFVQDRLGSSGKYYPYGEARGLVPQDAVGFATYTNDSATGLEYADQRYYASNFGRFMSPDPYDGSANTSSPHSHNRYTYAGDDPVNSSDPSGLMSPTGTLCNLGGTYYSGEYCDFVLGELNGPGMGYFMSPFGRALSVIYKATVAFLDKTSFSQNCLNDIAAVAAQSPNGANITIGTIQAALATTDYYNGIGSTESQSDLYPNSPQAAAVVAQQSIGSDFSNPKELVTAVTALGGDSMWINPNMIKGMSLRMAEGFLMHEMFHELGLTDDQIGAALHAIDPSINPNANGQWTNTQQFSNKFTKDCFSGKQNTPQGNQ